MAVDEPHATAFALGHASAECESDAQSVTVTGAGPGREADPVVLRRGGLRGGESLVEDPLLHVPVDAVTGVGDDGMEFGPRAQQLHLDPVALLRRSAGGDGGADGIVDEVA